MKLAIVAFVMSFFGGVIGLILSIIAQTRFAKRENANKYRGQGLNLAAFFISIVMLIVTVLFSAVVLSGISADSTTTDHESSSYAQSKHQHDNTGKDTNADGDASDHDTNKTYTTIQEYLDDHNDLTQSQIEAFNQNGMHATVYGEGKTALVLDVELNDKASLSHASQSDKKQAQDKMATVFDIETHTFTEILGKLEKAGFPNAHVKVHVHTTDNGFVFDREYDKNGPIA